jgi:hypothetical protein
MSIKGSAGKRKHMLNDSSETWDIISRLESAESQWEVTASHNNGSLSI